MDRLDPPRKRLFTGILVGGRSFDLVDRAEYAHGSVPTKIKHCYRWSVEWDLTKKKLAWCLLNPAQEIQNEFSRTGRHMIGITNANGDYGGFECVNVLSGVVTESSQIGDGSSFYSPDNDRYIKEIAERYGRVVCGWGNVAPFLYVHNALSLLESAELFCPGITRSGNPRHPGRLAYRTELVRWRLGHAR